MKQINECELKDPGKGGPVWITFPHPEAILLVKRALGAKAHVHVGQNPPEGEMPSSVVFCPNGEGVVQGMRRLRALVPDAPILVFGWSSDARLAEEALRAGASGFFHSGMQPERIARFFSLATKSEVVIPRELLVELMGRRLFLRRPKLLDL